MVMAAIEPGKHGRFRLRRLPLRLLFTFLLDEVAQTRLRRTLRIVLQFKMAALRHGTAIEQQIDRVMPARFAFTIPPVSSDAYRVEKNFSGTHSAARHRHPPAFRRE